MSFRVVTRQEIESEISRLTAWSVFDNGALERLSLAELRSLAMYIVRRQHDPLSDRVVHTLAGISDERVEQTLHALAVRKLGDYDTPIPSCPRCGQGDLYCHALRWWQCGVCSWRSPDRAELEKTHAREPVP